uniref:Uncharacterized protein n=1 Tax=Bionectria ochroleuca TaxID=29856 RepID=A0A8H7KA92_BIOOC
MFSKLSERLLIKNRDHEGNLRVVEYLDNDSIRPTPVKDRTWTQFTYTFFGLSMWESLACQLGGQLLAGLLMALNGRAGAMYRIPFPVLCRSSFGTWGALWPTFNRAAMVIVWNGVNKWNITALTLIEISVFLHAIFPSIAQIPDRMGPKSALTPAGMMCFFIYWLINCVFLLIPVPRMKGFIYAKVFVFFAATISMAAWTLSLSGNATATLNQLGTNHGSEKSWAIAQFLFLGLASSGTFISNAADLQRYARKPNDVILRQVFGFPISNLLVGILGNLIVASSVRIFGEFVWNPLETLDKLMAGDRYTPANRAGCAFISLALFYSTIFSAIFENSIPAGNDIAGLLPKYIDIKRGFFICAVLSYAICPWYLLSSAAVFITFLASYQIFLSAIAGIMICDYYLIQRGLLDVPSLYSLDKDGAYRFFHGFNIRAFAVYLIAVAPNFYGFLNRLGVAAPLGIQEFYYVAYPVGVLLAFLGFYLANLLSPLAWSERLVGWSLGII